MDRDEVLKNNEEGGENVSETEKIIAGLGDFVEKAKEQEGYEEWREYNVPVELTDKVAPVLKGLEKTAVDYSFDENNSKYVDDLDGFLGVDIDEEDFYDFETGRVDDDAYSDAKHTSRLQKINALGEDEHFGGYGFAEGFNLFNVKYDVDGGEEKSDETLTYTRDILGDRKSVPTSMTTGLAELLIEKLKEDGAGAETLAKMPSFEEHMAEKKEQEKTGKVGEVYGRVAKEALMKWNGLSEEEADEKIANSSFDELESMIGAKESIETGVNSICEDVGWTYLRRGEKPIESEEVLDFVLHGGESSEYNRLINILSEKCKNRGEDSYDPYINEVLFESLDLIHDKWVEDNEEKFFDEKRRNKRYQFLPFNRIGFKETTADLIFVKPIFEDAGMKFDGEEMRWLEFCYKDEYMPGPNDNFTWVEVAQDEAKKLYINPRGIYPEMPLRIAETIQGNYDLVEELVGHYIDLKEVLGDLVEDEDIDPETGVDDNGLEPGWHDNVYPLFDGSEKEIGLIDQETANEHAEELYWAGLSDFGSGYPD